MEKYCPICGKPTEWKEKISRDEFDVRGEKIFVEFPLFSCSICNTEFEDLNSEIDPYALAYEEYRNRKGMVHPNQIKEFRRKYDLTQKELSDLLGIGGITLSRYENGALQDEAHDQLLKFIFEPVNLYKAIREKERLFSAEKRNRLLPKLEEEAGISSYRLLNSEKHTDIYTGNTEFNFQKAVNLIKAFTSNQSIFKSKLFKLIFYADFSHFKEHGVSITGLQYAHLPYGPVPNNYNSLIGVIMNVDSSIYIEERIANDYPGEVILSSTPAENIFSKDEIETIRKIQDKFAQFTCKGIEEYSHEEVGYKETQNGELISYEYAKDLQI